MGACIRTLKDTTSAPLGISATYTGKSFKTELYNQVRGLVDADANGSVDFFESGDGVTWVKTSTAAITGGTPAAFAFTCHAYFARVDYVNGAGAQSSFNFQVYADPFTN